MRHLGWLVVVGVCFGACAHNVAQDKATGPDGKLKGAKPITLAEGQALVHGIVTYPGGDRVDWRSIEIPQGPPARLDLQLTWRAPRPGLQVAFDVFDAWGQPVVAASGGRRGHLRTARIDDARGTYFVRIYAPRRGDAGAYKLVAELTRAPVHTPGEIGDIPDPPKLAAVPDVEPECDPFDIKIKACRNVCPDFGAPAGWPPCAEKERLEKEKAERELIEKNKPPPPKPVVARVLHAETIANSSQVTLGIGSDRAPIDTTWTGVVLSTATGKPLVGGGLILVRVGKTQTLAKSLLTIDQLTANPQVQLSPPGKP